MDVAYHIAAALPVEVAECEERRLLDHYLDAVRRFGGNAPDAESTWATYRMSPVWGYLVAKIDPALEQQVLNVAQAQREAKVHHHHQPDRLRRRVKVTERIG